MDEGARRQGRVARPVAPRGPSGPVLEVHADDRHHCRAAVGELSVQALDLPLTTAPVLAFRDSAAVPRPAGGG